MNETHVKRLPTDLLGALLTLRGAPALPALGMHLPRQHSGDRSFAATDLWFLGAAGELAHLPMTASPRNQVRLAAVAALCGDDARSECSVYITTTVAAASVPRCLVCVNAWEVRQGIQAS